MKIAALALVLIVSGAMIVGCGGYRAPVMPPTASLVTNISAPLDHNVHDTKIGSKRGEASTIQVLGMVASGDASIQTAAANGKITTIYSVDYKYSNYVFGVYSKFTTIVTGE